MVLVSVLALCLIATAHEFGVKVSGDRLRRQQIEVTDGPASGSIPSREVKREALEEDQWHRPVFGDLSDLPGGFLVQSCSDRRVCVGSPKALGELI
jgi:hypothetical protein